MNYFPFNCIYFQYGPMREKKQSWTCTYIMFTDSSRWFEFKGTLKRNSSGWKDNRAWVVQSKITLERWWYVEYQVAKKSLPNCCAVFDQEVFDTNNQISHKTKNDLSLRITVCDYLTSSRSISLCLS